MKMKGQPAILLTILLVILQGKLDSAYGQVLTKFNSCDQLSLHTRSTLGIRREYNDLKREILFKNVSDFIHLYFIQSPAFGAESAMAIELVNTDFEKPEYEIVINRPSKSIWSLLRDSTNTNSVTVNQRRKSIDKSSVDLITSLWRTAFEGATKYPEFGIDGIRYTFGYFYGSIEGSTHSPRPGDRMYDLVTIAKDLMVLAEKQKKIKSLPDSLITKIENLKNRFKYGDRDHISKLLNEFLSKVDQKEMHDRFWADELIYTGSSGRRIGKADIMAGFDGESNDGGPTTAYSAEEVQIKVKDHLAILAFRLVAKTDTNGEVKTAHYYNSGALENQGGEWKVILWQATKIPDTE